jgi:RHS repeat-associated protein
LIRKNGSKVWEGEYRAFGELVTEGGGWENRLRFPGQYFDEESGNYYNYYRDYDPAIGSYIQEDPIGHSGGQNIYKYVKGNPNRQIDPSGLFCTSDFVWHYFFGGGEPVHLKLVGLLGAFQSSNSVQNSVMSFQKIISQKSRQKAISLCSGDDPCNPKGVETGTVGVNDMESNRTAMLTRPDFNMR